MKYDAIIVAAGAGKRLSLGYNKVFYVLKDNRTILDHSMSLFLEDEECQKIIVVTNSPDFEKVHMEPKVVLTQGGSSRTESVYAGLQLCESPYVLVHDGARPYLSSHDLGALKKKVEECGAAILAVPVKDTLKVVENDKIISTPVRSSLYKAQTPQGFKTAELLFAYKHRKEGVIYTDDASLMEEKRDVSVVPGSFSNIKVTTPEDLK